MTRPDVPTAFTQAIDAFLTYALAEQGLASRSIDAYRQDLSDFTRFVVARGALSPARVQHAAIPVYLISLRRQGRAASTVKRRTAAIRSFYKYLQRGRAGARSHFGPGVPAAPSAVAPHPHSE